ncbi:hypothetical protein D3C81_1061370 [compost metagenome]
MGDLLVDQVKEDSNRLLRDLLYRLPDRRNRRMIIKRDIQPIEPGHGIIVRDGLPAFEDRLTRPDCQTIGYRKQRRELLPGSQQLLGYHISIFHGVALDLFLHATYQILV